MSAMTERVRAAVVASLLYAAWTAATCPCEVLCECKLGQFYAAAAVPMAVVAYVNAYQVA